MNKPLIGEILIKRKKITQDQLTNALNLQKKNNGFIGEILISLGYIDEKDIVVALVVQCGLPYIAVNKYKIDEAILGLIPQNVAQEEKLIPLDRIGKVLSVVMTNPLSDERKNKLEALTQCSIATFISTKTEIEDAIARSYQQKV